jgi:hypothetical protein
MVPRAILTVAIGVPALIFLLSIFRVIAAGQVGVKVLFGQVDPRRSGRAERVVEPALRDRPWTCAP